MIYLKPKVNKSAVTRELKDRADKTYSESWQKGMQIRAYMNGVHDTLKRLRISDVQYKCNHQWRSVDLQYNGTTFICDKCGAED